METYTEELDEPKINFYYLIDYIKCKFQYLYLKCIYRNINNLIEK